MEAKPSACSRGHSPFLLSLNRKFLLKIRHKGYFTITYRNYPVTLHKVQEILRDCETCLSVEIVQLQNIPFGKQETLLWQRDRVTGCQYKFCNYKTSNLKSIVWHYLQMDGQTDGQTYDDGIYHA